MRGLCFRVLLLELGFCDLYVFDEEVYGWGVRRFFYVYVLFGFTVAGLLIVSRAALMLALYLEYGACNEMKHVSFL